MEIIRGGISTEISASITTAVSRFYEKHPYPNYPLLARPRVEDGFLSTAGLAKCLQFHPSPSIVQATSTPEGSDNILLAGCGEILAYIIRRNEPAKSHILAVDLSAQSLRRAKLRLGFWRPNIEFRQQDIVETLGRSSESRRPFSHIDAYGVLHHLANPAVAVNGMANSLTPNGTIRLMVYNSQARDWIHQFQRIFQLMKFDNFERQDYKEALEFIKDACAISPELRARFARVGRFTLNNRSRFCDTFLHVREARISYERWGTIFSEAGLSSFALFDRYGELDDLPNPLWKVPNRDELAARIADRRFENNFELYLCRTNILPERQFDFNNNMNGLDSLPWPSDGSLLSPFGRFPHNWSTFAETRAIPPGLFRALWKMHRAITGGRASAFFDESLIRQFPHKAIQRLARIGAILPQMIHTEELRRLAFSPMTNSMEIPYPHDGNRTFPEKLRVLVTKVLLERKIFNEKVLEMIMSRLLRAS